MADWSTGYLNVAGIRLFYTRTGGDKPPIVLAHGVTDDGLCWTPVAEALETDYDVIMVDARGHGRSDAPETGYGPVEQAGDLAGVIAGLGLDSPVTLGHSMGAVTALVHAGLHPDQPGGVILEDPPSWWALHTQHIPEDSEPWEEFQAWIKEIKSKTRAKIIEDQGAEAPTWSDAELGPWADSKLRFHENALSMFRLETIEDVDWNNVLARVRAPILAITADPDLGAALTPEGAAALKDHIPHLKVENIPGAGHNIRREQFERYMQVVRDFLEEVYR